MPVNETDLELLETYLDQALAPSQIPALRQRLAADAELSGALSQLNSQRAMRAAVWATLEPTDSATQQMNWRIRGALADRQRAAARVSWLNPRIGSAAAACVVFGFFAGWMGRGNPAPLPSQNPSPSIAVNDQNPSIPAPSTPLLVPVTTADGQVVNWTQFQDANQAKNFMENMRQAQGDTVVSPTDDKIKLISEQKF